MDSRMDMERPNIFLPDSARACSGDDVRVKARCPAPRHRPVRGAEVSLLTPWLKGRFELACLARSPPCPSGHDARASGHGYNHLISHTTHARTLARPGSSGPPSPSDGWAAWVWDALALSQRHVARHGQRTWAKRHVGLTMLERCKYINLAISKLSFPVSRNVGDRS